MEFLKDSSFDCSFLHFVSWSHNLIIFSLSLHRLFLVLFILSFSLHSYFSSLCLYSIFFFFFTLSTFFRSWLLPGHISVQACGHHSHLHLLQQEMRGRREGEKFFRISRVKADDVGDRKNERGMGKKGREG